MRPAAIGAPGVAIAAIFAVVALRAAAPAAERPVHAGPVEARTRHAAAGVHPLSANIDAAAIARAIAIGRSSDPAARLQFHDAYTIPLGDALLDSLEIVTEFRRVVLATEDRVRAGDINWGPRQAAAMLQPWRDRVTLVLHVTFPPNNTYRAMPPFGIVLYGRPEARQASRIDPLDLLETPRYVSGQPAPPGTPILAGIVQATFRATRLDARGVYLAGIASQGRELRRVEVDFGRFE